MRELMLKANRTKSKMQMVKIVGQMRPQHFTPELPAITEFSTNEIMGHSADRLAAAFNITRKEQDDFARRCDRFKAKFIKTSIVFL